MEDAEEERASCPLLGAVMSAHHYQTAAPTLGP